MLRSLLFSRFHCWFGGVLTLMMSACASISSVTQPPPDWITHTPRGCAVGDFPRQSSHYLTQTGAANRARAALARQISVDVESVIRTYLEESSLTQQHLYEEMISESLQSTHQVLRGTRSRSTFQDQGASRTFYLLMCVEHTPLMRLFENLTPLPPPHRDSLRARAHDAFSELELMND